MPVPPWGWRHRFIFYPQTMSRCLCHVLKAIEAAAGLAVAGHIKRRSSLRPPSYRSPTANGTVQRFSIGFGITYIRGDRYSLVAVELGTSSKILRCRSKYISWEIKPASLSLFSSLSFSSWGSKADGPGVATCAPDLIAGGVARACAGAD